ncbi:MAG TPA: radical SAM protein [Chthonomonadaceae bacterium]|nr:radical SAM protein [Chthonomonadaceae bacterium]
MHVMLVGPEFEENLSLRYLAAALRQAGHTAGLARFDSPEYAEGVVQQVLRTNPGLVGLSMVFQVRAREFYALARALRQAGYTGHITAGGHFATFVCEPMLKEVPELDSIVRQEGEETLVELVEAIERGASLDELARIPGMAVRDADGAVVLAPPRHQARHLDTLPFPIRDAVPERHLGVPTAYLVGSRGCYADCEYCCIFAWHEAAVGKRYRMRTVANIADEMAWLYHERGVRFFVFHDDNFFLPTAAGSRKRFEALHAEIRQRGLNDIGLMLKLRPNDCDHENLLILKDIGLLRAFVGIENASQRQLRTLGRDSTVEDVQACLRMLRELDIYATYNILLFDPYTTLDDVALNLRFLRQNLFTPFNWCKVEPYAGTELEKRYAREGRLRGDYLGWDYAMDDPRARLLYDLLLPAFYYRNYDYYGLANLNIGLGYHRQLLKHFYPDGCTPDLCDRVQALIETINANTLDLLERATLFARDVDLANRAEIERFGEQLKRDSFHGQHRLSARIESVLREIEQAAGVRQEARVHSPVAFVPLRPTPLARRSLLGVLASGLLWLLAGCRHVPSGQPPQAPQNPTPPSGIPAVKITTPQGVLRVAPGSPETVAAWEHFTLEAVLLPEEAQVLGEPRVTASGGEIKRVQAEPGSRMLRIEYRPGGGSRRLDPNETVSVAWTVRGPEGDTVILTRAFVHVNEDGSYSFGYETPRPTIAEMAAPPIYRGPKPGS